MRYTSFFFIILMLTFTTQNLYAQPNKIINSDAFFWSGRIIKTKQSVMMNWPATQLRTQFTGTSLKVCLEGKSVWEAQINNEPTIRIKVSEQEQCTSIANKLNKKTHQLRLVKISENQANMVKFKGLILDKDASVKPLHQTPKRRIEFIGDSYTVGFGNESKYQEPPPGIADSLSFYSTNSAKSYGAILARSFEADYQINGLSGKGLVNNFNQVIPDKEYLYFYNQSLISPKNNLDKDNLWDFSSWHPQIIVINIGINDFQLNNQDRDSVIFIDKYRKFLEFLRDKHPGVKFVLGATNIFPKNRLKEIVQQIVALEKKEHPDNIVYFEFNSKNTGLYWHPSWHDHENIANKLKPIVAKLGNWLSR